ncbi:MAG: zinc metallopeptidase [Bacilli bacterium]|nr:zinc metallopeptidase [Bacilli bacterium]
MNYLVSYGLIIIGSIITLAAQGFISTCYSKYKKVKNESGIKGSEMARYILDKHGLKNVKVLEVSGELTDHYDPSAKVVRLSSDIYSGDTVASISVAAHECGHAIQDQEGYLMMRIRSRLVPIVNFSSYAGYFAIMVGFLFGLTKIVWLGIYFELAILLFQLVTLPVEIDASKRGLKELKNHKKVDESEYRGSKIMLVAAASTYVASVATTLLQILRLVLIISGRERD